MKRVVGTTGVRYKRSSLELVSSEGGHGVGRDIRSGDDDVFDHLFELVERAGGVFTLGKVIRHRLGGAGKVAAFQRVDEGIWEEKLQNREPEEGEKDENGEP